MKDMVDEGGRENPGEELHPKFRKWLERGIKNPSDIQSVLKDIQDNLLPLFRYNHFHLGDEKTTVERDPELAMSLIFRNAVRAGDFSLNSGNCNELSVKAFLLIKKKYPMLAGKMMIPVGNEPKYFMNNGSVHVFLIVVDGNIECNGRVIEDYEDMVSGHSPESVQAKGKMYLVDPAFGLVKPWEWSGYTMKSPMKLIRPDAKNRELRVLQDGTQIAFGQMEWSPQVASLSFPHDGGVAITLSNKGGRGSISHRVEPGSFLNTLLCKEPEMLRAVLAVREKVNAAMKM